MAKKIEIKLVMQITIEQRSNRSKLIDTSNRFPDKQPEHVARRRRSIMIS
jgi:hypothetical protein